MLLSNAQRNSKTNMRLGIDNIYYHDIAIYHTDIASYTDIIVITVKFRLKTGPARSQLSQTIQPHHKHEFRILS